jgi:hypothetical protein
VRSGVVPIPAGVRDLVGEGRWPLFTDERARVGELSIRRGFAWGWVRTFRRHGAGIGDVVHLDIDRATASATIRVGGPELFEQVDRLENPSPAGRDGPLCFAQPLTHGQVAPPRSLGYGLAELAAGLRRAAASDGSDRSDGSSR